MHSKKFIISFKEIKGRKKAYTTLILSIFLSSIVFSLKSIRQNYPFSILILLIFALILLVTRILLFKFFSNYLKTFYLLSDNSIVRDTIKTKEKFHFNDLSKLKVTLKSSGTLRRIWGYQNSGKSWTIDGVDKFEDFWELLRKSISEDVEIVIRREPINFDHPNFYSLLGVILCLLCVFGISAINTVSPSDTLMILMAIFIYNLILGIYIMTTKPMSKSWGPVYKKIDIISGVAIIAVTILVMVFIYT